MEKKPTLSEREIAYRIRDWFEALYRSVPEDDPRRTPECLSIPQAVAVAAKCTGGSAGSREHIAKCTYCQTVLRLARKVLAEQGKSISRPANGWVPILAKRLRQWVESQKTERDAPAHFDANGVLHVHWRGLPRDGVARVSLRWGKVKISLGRGRVHQGVLSIRESLPHLGLKNCPLSVRALELEWEEDAPAECSQSAAEENNSPKEVS